MRNKPNYHLQVSTVGAGRFDHAELLAKFPTTTGTISQADGLALVRYCCDRLEEEVGYFESEQPDLLSN
jgi:carboxylate-amine ligase